MKMNNSCFEPERIRISTEKLLPIRLANLQGKASVRYTMIVASIKEVGIIEPVMVHRQSGPDELYLVLDGNLRLAACKELGISDVECLVASDDEAYTYNARINRLAPIQEREMILKAINNGVPIARIAASLNVRPAVITARISMTNGIAPEVIDLLREKQMSGDRFRLLRRVVPSRQVEIAELMVAANNYSEGYVEALVLGTPQSKLLAPSKKNKRAKPEEIARMSKEMEGLESEYKMCEKDFAANILQLTVFRRFVIRLLENPKVKKFISTRHPDLHAELQEIAESEMIC